MDLPKMIAELQAEKERLDQAIQALERLSASKARRRGRPPRWIKEGHNEHEIAQEEEGEPAENNETSGV